MTIKVLHINRNYIFNKLHQSLIDCLDREQLLQNSVFVPTSKEQNVDCQINENVVVSQCFRLRDRFFYRLKQLKIYRSLKKSFTIGDYDIIHAYTLFTDGGCAYRIKKKYGKPFVVAIRNTDINDFFKKLPFLRGYGKRILKEAEAIFFLSKPYMETLVDNYLTDVEKKELCHKMYLIPNGVDPFWLINRFHRGADDVDHLSTRLRVIYAGRIDFNKNIESTAKAIETLINENMLVEFTVIGKIECNDVYERLKQFPFIKYKPEMSKEKLIEEYRKNDIFVMPSFTETFGITYVEAMSQGLPVIYSEKQGFDEQFEEGVVGYHVNPHDINDIARKIHLIVNNYQCISNNCSLRCDDYNWINISKKYKRIYTSIFEKG